MGTRDTLDRIKPPSYQDSSAERNVGFKGVTGRVVLLRLSVQFTVSPISQILVGGGFTVRTPATLFLVFSPRSEVNPQTITQYPLDRVRYRAKKAGSLRSRHATPTEKLGTEDMSWVVRGRVSSRSTRKTSDPEGHGRTLLAEGY